MILSEQDSGRTIEVSPGDILTVRLKENPTTGYRWTVEGAQGMEQISDRFEASGAIGAAGVREIQLRVTQAGTRELRLQNRREWEGESSGSQFAATIIVK